MERDKVIKALECWASGNACEGSRCELFDISPDTCDRWIGRNALSLIKELTEENERLEDNLIKQSTENIMLLIVQREIKADTVRKMQELIKERCIKGGIYPAFVARTIDKIAKEMLVGDNESLTETVI